MEHIAFLIEHNHERVRCMLNPDSLVVRRSAGLRPRHLPGGRIARSGASDDPILYTGGGRTEIDLDLLFDVSLAGSSVQSDDVRELTGPLWALAENRSLEGGHPPVVRLIWGKSWNIPGVVAAISERLEHFTASGMPRRSWLRMRLLRVAEPAPGEPVARGRSRPGRRGQGGELVHEAPGSGAAKVAPPLPDPTAPADLDEIRDQAWSALIATAARELGEVFEELEGRYGPGTDPPPEAGAGPDADATAGLTGLPAGAGGQPPGDSPTPLAQPTPVAQRVLGAVTRVRRALASLWSAARRRASGALSSARLALTRAVQDAAEELAGLRELATGVGEGLGRSISKAIGSLRALAENLRQTPRRIARAVRARAEAVLTAAIGHLRTGADRILGVVAAVHTAAADVREGLRAAVAAVHEQLGRLAEAGRSALDRLRASIADAGRYVTRLIAEGYHGAGRLLRNVLGSMAAASNNSIVALRAAAEALGGRAVDLAARLRHLLAGFLAGDEGAGVDAAIDAVDSLDEVARSSDAAAAAPLLAQLDDLRAALEAPDPAAAVAGAVPDLADLEVRARQLLSASQLAHDELLARAVEGPRLHTPAAGERLDLLAHRYYGDPALWRAIAERNDVDFPLEVTGLGPLLIPSLPRGG